MKRKTKNERNIQSTLRNIQIMKTNPHTETYPGYSAASFSSFGFKYIHFRHQAAILSSKETMKKKT